MSAKIITATVERAAKQVTTKYGDRLVANLKTADGREVQLWKPLNDTSLAALQRGQQVQLIEDSKGFNLLAPEETKDDRPDYLMSNDRKRQVATYLDQMGDLLAYCRKTATQKLEEAPEEAIQAATATLFIAAQRKFNL